VVPAETTLLLIRHGETQWNAESRIQGHRDVALSARGRRQAEVLARFLASAAIDAVFASDLSRASQTAEPLARALGLPLRVDARLRERGFGLFEGSTYAEAEANWPNEYAIWRRRDPAHALPGGESYVAARVRVLQCLEEIARDHQGQTVAVITHGGVLDIVYRAAFGIPWETPRSHLLPNASINRVLARHPGPALTVSSWAERSHLDDALDELT
jgi:2,3-bisphosphoglycerate-dependent phosphoglycerate mutase